jgi:hypothetical protein
MFEEDNDPFTEDNTIADALSRFRDLVAKGAHEEAYTVWKKMEGQVDGFTYWYNLGTLETLRKNFPEARYALERARHYTVISDVTEDQLDYVNTQLAFDHAPPHTGAWLLEGFLSIGLMKAWFVTVVLIIFLALTIRKNWQRWQKLLIAGAMITPITLLLWFSFRSTAFINFKPLPLYEGPSEAFPSGRALVAGSRVLGWKAGRWIKVYDGEGELNWIKTTDVFAQSGILWGTRP